MAALAKKKVPTHGREAERQALDMTRLWRNRRITLYQPGMVDRAQEEGRPLRVMKNGRAKLISPNRKVHRSDLLDCFGETHAQSGTGKYIDRDALHTSNGQTVVKGAHRVNPYLAADGSYHTLIETFHHLAKGQIELLTAQVVRNREFGHHLRWNGKRDKNDAVAVTPWMTKEELWELACKLCPDVKTTLKQSKSNVKGVAAHASVREKFFQNIDVLRRARRVFSVATGEHEFGGGETPYSMPLEQCGFAIDMAFLTTGVDAQGNEIGEYRYRMAYGRSTPWVLYERDWKGMTTNDHFAYISEQVRHKAITARRRAS